MMTKNMSSKLFEVMKPMKNTPMPLPLSNLWNMGFLLGMTMLLQVLSGILLSMFYIPSTTDAFNSIIHIMRDINNGWLMRYLHMNMASLLFLLMYMHIMRGIYFNSPSNLKKVWMSGMIILLISMMSAFMGYVLPWGQMSYWGATVITSMLSSIPYLGETLMNSIWGNFSVSQPTLNRLFSLHFLCPMLILLMIMIHILLLHSLGSSNPLGTITNLDKMKFSPYLMIKDIQLFTFMLMMLLLLIFHEPNMFSDMENFNKASMISTPAHIQPEWYFLFAYTILRSVPSKLGGVILMISSILILMFPMMKKQQKNKKFNPSKKFYFWMFITNWVLLTWLGMKPVEKPFNILSMIFMSTYFSLSLLI